MWMRTVADKKAHFWERRFWSTLHGKTAVIAGIGIVGIAIGEALKALGMHVVGVTRTPRARGRLRRNDRDRSIGRRSSHARII